MGLDRIASSPKTTSKPSENSELTPLHAAFVEVAELHPRAASRVLYQNFLLPDQSLGTTMATTCTYYSKGAEILIQLGDYQKAFEFLTIALAARHGKHQRSFFIKLLFMSVLSGQEGKLSRHIPANAFKESKASHRNFAEFLKGLQLTDNFKVFEYLSELNELAKSGFKTEVLEVIRLVRERRIQELRKIYLSVNSDVIAGSDKDLKEYKNTWVCDDISEDPLLSLNNLDPEMDKRTRQYVYFLIMSGAVNGRIEEGGDAEYIVTFSQEPYDKGKPLTIEDQILRLHSRLDEVAEISKLMDYTGREIVRSSKFEKAKKLHNGADAGIYESVEEESFLDSATRLLAQRLPGVGQGSRGFDTFDRRRSFRQMADDSQDVEGTDTSGVDTLDDEEL